MSEIPLTIANQDCPTFEGIVQNLLQSQFSEAVEDYSSMLDEDPSYLTYHRTRIALKLQFQLKCGDIPSLDIGACFDRASGECCVIRALREAIRRKRLLSPTTNGGQP